jgi:hypothetical protein
MVLSVPILVLVGIVSYATRSFSLIPLGVVLLIGILPNPGSAGLQALARELANREILTMGDQWRGLRHYWLLALRMWLLSSLVCTILVANATFYSRATFFGAGLVDFVALYLLLVWLAAHLYVYPLIVEQQDKSVLLIYRNALLMAVSRPLFTLVVFLIWIAVLAVAAATGLATVAGLALGAAIQQNAAARILPTFPASEAGSQSGPSESDAPAI